MHNKIPGSSSKGHSNPFTPIRRFFLKLTAPGRITSLGKRDRNHHLSSSNEFNKAINPSQHKTSLGESPVVVSGPFSREADQAGFPKRSRDVVIGSPSPRDNHARVALQQQNDTFDAVVISTLPSYPFCCHEDLLMMSRQRLIEVASLLNSRLSSTDQIECGAQVSTLLIRHSIEVLVGIIPEVPAAPKATRARPPYQHGLDPLLSSPCGPLAKQRKTRRQEKALPIMSTPPRLLESLEEEGEEGELFKIQPPPKRRRLSEKHRNKRVDLSQYRPFEMPGSDDSSPTWLQVPPSPMSVRSRSSSSGSNDDSPFEGRPRWDFPRRKIFFFGEEKVAGGLDDMSLDSDFNGVGNNTA